MGIINNLFGNATSIDLDTIRKEYDAILYDGEQLETAFRIFRDKWVFHQPPAHHPGYAGPDGQEAGIPLPALPLDLVLLHRNGRNARRRLRAQALAGRAQRAFHPRVQPRHRHPQPAKDLGAPHPRRGLTAGPQPSGHAPMTARAIELLAPARDADTGIEAVRHGADAVYIGGPGFGARAAAGNPVGDIARLADYAHTFGARVYVTLNTILYDDELPAVERLVHQLHRAGADALIVQDMGLLRLDLPPIALHASTQMDNRTPEKVAFLARAGFEQVVLARELSLADIRAIHAATPVALEAFVHGGALREPQRPVLRLAVLLPPLGQPRRVRPVLPPGLRPGRRRRQDHRPRQAPALAARHEPHARHRGHDGRRSQLLQNRRPAQRHRLRQEHHGPLPPCHRRRHPAPPRRLLPRLVRHLDLLLHPQPGKELQPRFHGLFPARTDARRRGLVRHTQGHGRSGRPGRGRRRTLVHGRRRRAFRQRRRPLLCRRVGDACAASA